MEEQKEFKICGKVRKEETGEEIPYLIVEALNKNLLLDKRLKQVTTDKKGNFEIVYNKSDFQEIFLEKMPDIYLRIKNAEGKILFTIEDKVKYTINNTEEVMIDIPGKLLENTIESERYQFSELINLNPNYFGNLPENISSKKFPHIISFKKNTKYEELKCVGINHPLKPHKHTQNPEEQILEAVIEVKLPYGYKGKLCDEGGKEYVAFYIDYHQTNNFVSLGAPAEVSVHNLDETLKNSRYFAVYKPFKPYELHTCRNPHIVRVRAILSWEVIPTGPDFIPVWGNVVDVSVQIASKSKIKVLPTIPDYAVEKPLGLKITPEPLSISSEDEYIFIGDGKEVKELIELSLAEEEKIKNEGKVEKDRYDYKNIISDNINYFSSITESKDEHKILKSICKLPEPTVGKLLPIDPNKLVPIKKMSYNTTYEELKCVGLYPEGDLMEAVIEIKRNSGYGNSLCNIGSSEYVAFYINWGTGYEHIATSNITVHDIPKTDKNHLFYAVKAEIPNIKDKLKSCTEDNIVKIKAILSWDLDPTPYGSDFKPPWGNVLIRNIQIRPEDGDSVKCCIEIVNGVHVNDIGSAGNSDEGLAVKIDEKGNNILGVHDRPFGGIIACWGNVNIPGADLYRFCYHDGVTWKNITNPRKIRNHIGQSIPRYPDEEGWFKISEYKTDCEEYSLTALVHWQSYGKNDQFPLKLQLADTVKTVISEHEILINLDNTGPELFSFGGTPIPASGVLVKDNAGEPMKCLPFEGENEVHVWGNFRDNYFKNYTLTLFGGKLSSGITVDSARYDDFPLHQGIDLIGIIGAYNNGSGADLITLNLCKTLKATERVKCAYGIHLTVWDRAIVGSISGYEFDKSEHSRSAYVTFDWDPAGC